MPSRPTPSRPSRSSERDVPRRGPSARASAATLDGQLCFALYAASNAIQRRYAPLLRALGLTYVQYLVLLVLWERDCQSVVEIGRRLYLDSGTLTPVLRRLERCGFITRRRASDDERELRIALTAAGVALEPALDAVRAEIACRVALDANAFGRLRDELRGLRARLAAAGLPGTGLSASDPSIELQKPARLTDTQ